MIFFAFVSLPTLICWFMIYFSAQVYAGLTENSYAFAISEEFYPNIMG